MEEQTVLVTSSNFAGASSPYLTFPLAFLAGLLGQQFHTVSTASAADEERESLHAFTERQRLLRDCPFPPEPDWA